MESRQSIMRGKTGRCTKESFLTETRYQTCEGHARHVRHGTMAISRCHTLVASADGTRAVHMRARCPVASVEAGRCGRSNWTMQSDYQICQAAGKTVESEATAQTRLTVWCSRLGCDGGGAEYKENESGKEGMQGTRRRGWTRGPVPEF